jgi:tetratricopeptide (TPR) repeat protein
MNRLIETSLMGVLLFMFSTTSSNGIDSHIQRDIYYPKLSKNLQESKTTIARILNDKCVTIYDSANAKIKYKNASIFDDRIELTLKTGVKTIYFSSLFGEYDIKVNSRYTIYGDNDRDDYYDQISGLKNILIEKNDSAFFGMKFRNQSGFPVCDKDLADALYFMQQKVNSQRYDNLLMAFNPLAQKYQSLAVKPTVPEEQRKYIVKANLLNQQKEYEKAIELYEKAVGIDQIAYPAAYNNLALLFAQVHSFNTAIYYMKLYLLLGPEVQDARAAQDKIYEWETMMGN